MASTIITKNSSTASATPAVGDLQQGELAVNVTDKKVYTKDSSAAIVKLVGSLGNQEASAVAITGGSIAGITDLAVADGGTGSSTAAGARSNLSAAASGANSDITSLSGLTTALSVAQGGTGVTSSTGSGSVVLSNSPTLLTPALGTPSAAVLTNATGLPLSTGISGLGTGVATFLGTPSSANLLAAVTDETGTGALVFANSPTLVTPALGTPSSATLTNATGLPISTGVSGLGTGVATALAVNVGSAGAPVVNGGVLGTPSSATLTNATGLPISTGVSGLGTGVATALAVNVGSAGAPVVNGGALGTPSSGTVTNLTGTASININGTVGATTPTTGAFTTLSASSTVTISGGTANGVAYLNGSKVLTSGSALTFDGTNFVVNNGYIRANNTLGYYTTLTATGLTNFATSMDFDSVSDYIFKRNSSEQMRLTSTGLGIKTSSISEPLTLGGTGNIYAPNGATWYTGGTLYVRAGSGGNLNLGANGSNSLAVLDTSGNLGLGVTPSAWSGMRAFQLGDGTFAMSSDGAGAGDGSLTWNGYYNGTNWIYGYTGGGANRFRLNESGAAWFTAPSGTAGNAISFTQAMTLDASGRLLIGSTTNTTNSNLILSGATRWAVGTQSGGNIFYIVRDSDNVGQYMVQGSTSWTATSDERLKDIIEPITNASSKVSTLRAVIGKFKKDAEGTRRSFLIAQDVQAVLPEAVTVQEDEFGTLGIQYTEVIPLLVAAIKEQNTVIESLKARLDAANI